MDAAAKIRNPPSAQPGHQNPHSTTGASAPGRHWGLASLVPSHPTRRDRAARTTAPVKARSWRSTDGPGGMDAAANTQRTHQARDPGHNSSRSTTGASAPGRHWGLASLVPSHPTRRHHAARTTAHVQSTQFPQYGRQRRHGRRRETSRIHEHEHARARIPALTPPTRPPRRVPRAGTAYRAPPARSLLRGSPVGDPRSSSPGASPRRRCR